MSNRSLLCALSAAFIVAGCGSAGPAATQGSDPLRIAGLCAGVSLSTVRAVAPSVAVGHNYAGSSHDTPDASTDCRWSDASGVGHVDISVVTTTAADYASDVALARSAPANRTLSGVGLPTVTLRPTAPAGRNTASVSAFAPMDRILLDVEDAPRPVTDNQLRALLVPVVKAYLTQKH